MYTCSSSIIGLSKSLQNQAHFCECYFYLKKTLELRENGLCRPGKKRKLQCLFTILINFMCVWLANQDIGLMIIIIVTLSIFTKVVILDHSVCITYVIYHHRRPSSSSSCVLGQAAGVSPGGSQLCGQAAPKFTNNHLQHH